MKIHSDNDSTNAANELDCQAFTRGKDIFFGSGKYETGTSAGKHLLAHELTHVIQQGSAKTNIKSNTTNSAPNLLHVEDELIQRQPKNTNVKSSKEAPKPKNEETEVAPGIIQLKGNASLKPPEATEAWLDKNKTGLVNVRFGNIAEGTIRLNKTKNKYQAKKQAILMIPIHFL